MVADRVGVPVRTVRVVAAIETLSFPQPTSSALLMVLPGRGAPSPVLRDEFERHAHLHYAIRPAVIPVRGVSHGFRLF